MAEGRRKEDASIRVDGLGFSYGKREVLKDVSFSVRAGEFVGILGPNGSGKTTLLNCVSGALRFHPAAASVPVTAAFAHVLANCCAETVATT